MTVTKFEMKSGRGTGKTQWLIEQVKKSKGTKIYIGSQEKYKELADKYLRTYREAIKLPFLRLETDIEKITKLNIFTDDCSGEDFTLVDSFIRLLKAQDRYYGKPGASIEVVWYKTEFDC